MARPKKAIPDWHPRGMPLREPMKLSHYFRFQHGKLVWFEDQFDISRASDLFDGLPTSPQR